MEELLKMAQKKAEQVEIFALDQKFNEVSFENAQLHEIATGYRSGVSLRIIKDKKLGFAYTRNLINPEELIQNALASLVGNVLAEYELPYTNAQELPKLDTYDESIEEITSTQMVKECERVCDILKPSGAEIFVWAFTYSNNLRILNHRGTDLHSKSSLFGIGAKLTFPGTAAGIYRMWFAKKFEPMPDNLINELALLYQIGLKEVKITPGKMKVLFMPNDMYTLNWRFMSGTSGKSVYEKISPIAEKLGEKIFSEKITIYDDPLNDQYPQARAFDDEGVKTQKLILVENGVLKSFYYDLNYAQKLGTKSTGNGYRTGQWETDPLALKPTPSLEYLQYKPGEKTIAEIIANLDRGIIIEGALGAHSGNIPNGDFSIGANPALYVENGEIVGQVKDVMVAGNIYEIYKNVIEVSKDTYPSSSGVMPGILFDYVTVATK
ncbi:MAG: TldD/PmbA family protein [candidate division WOR-3 bacterium]|nr:TldD/PmbA family protein [candidate division WOR-3 bacterium]MDW7987599.1 metallopeptidase TldD-related protein [candidate division WOR-3 bacterium]